MIHIKRNLIFSLEKRKKDGQLITDNVPIRLRINYGGTRLDIQTGYRIDTVKWNEVKEQVKNGSFNKLGQSASSINSRILELKVAIQDFFQEFETQDKIPTKDQIRQVAKILKEKGIVEIKKTSKFSFFIIFDKFVKESSSLNNWSDATIAKFSSVRKHLISFNQNLSFENFDESGLADYLLFLLKVKKMRNSTIKKQLGFLKWFLKWAAVKGYNDFKAFESFKPKIKTTPKKVIFLTSEELKKLSEYKIPEGKKYMERVRDVFLFCCYSGLRYSDVKNLKRSDIKKNHFETVTVKTGDSLFIDLNNYTRSILDKYKHIPYKNDNALPVISNQKTNEYLQDLAELAGINELVHETFYKGNERFDIETPKYDLLGTHAGRRTFICFALSLGIPVQVIIKWTGHADYKSMKPYIDVADNIKANAMNKFNML